MAHKPPPHTPNPATGKQQMGPRVSDQARSTMAPAAVSDPRKRKSGTSPPFEEPDPKRSKGVNQTKDSHDKAKREPPKLDMPKNNTKAHDSQANTTKLLSSPASGSGASTPVNNTLANNKLTNNNTAPDISTTAYEASKQLLKAAYLYQSHESLLKLKKTIEDSLNFDEKFGSKFVAGSISAQQAKLAVIDKEIKEKESMVSKYLQTVQDQVAKQFQASNASSDVQAQLQQITALLDKQNRENESLKKENQELKARFSGLENAMKDLNKVTGEESLVGLLRKLEPVPRSINKLQGEIGANHDQALRVQDDVKHASGSIKRIEATVNELAKKSQPAPQNNALRERVDKLSEEMARLTTATTEDSRKVKDLETKHNATDTRLDSVETRIESHKMSVRREVDGFRSFCTKTVDTGTNTAKKASEDVDKVKHDFAEAKADFDQVKVAFDQVKGDFDQVKVNVQTMDTKLRARDDEYSDLKSTLTQLEKSTGEVLQRMSTLTERRTASPAVQQASPVSGTFPLAEAPAHRLNNASPLSQQIVPGAPHQQAPVQPRSSSVSSPVQQLIPGPPYQFQTQVQQTLQRLQAHFPNFQDQLNFFQHQLHVLHDHNHSLEQRYENINTEVMARRMANQMKTMYPHAANAQAQIARLQADIEKHQVEFNKIQKDLRALGQHGNDTAKKAGRVEAQLPALVNIVGELKVDVVKAKDAAQQVDRKVRPLQDEVQKIDERMDKVEYVMSRTTAHMDVIGDKLKLPPLK